MGFGHRPYAKQSVLYLPSVRSIGRDAFHRNQYLVKADPAKLTIYHPGTAAAWTAFVPAGNPRVPVRQQDE